MGSECSIIASNVTLFLNEIYLILDENIMRNVFDFSNDSSFHLYVNCKILINLKNCREFLFKMPRFRIKMEEFSNSMIPMSQYPHAHSPTLL